MKLSDVAYETETAKQVEITDHLGRSFEPKASVSVLSWKSRTGSKALIEMQRESMKVMQSKKEGENIDDAIRAISIDALSKLVAGWENIEDEKGKPFEFSEKNAKKLLENSYILDIIDRFASNLGNFLKA